MLSLFHQIQTFEIATMVHNQNKRNPIWKIYRYPAKSTYRTPHSGIDDPTRNRGAQLVHQPSFIKKIASEFESAFAISSALKFAGKGVGTKQECECPEREITVVYGQENRVGERPVARTGAAETNEVLSRAIATSKKGDDDSDMRSDDKEGKFSDYINQVKRRMRTVSTIGGARPNASKDDKVTTCKNRFNGVSFK